MSLAAPRRKPHGEEQSPLLSAMWVGLEVGAPALRKASETTGPAAGLAAAPENPEWKRQLSHSQIPGPQER